MLVDEPPAAPLDEVDDVLVLVLEAPLLPDEDEAPPAPPPPSPGRCTSIKVHAARVIGNANPKRRRN